MTGLSHLLSCVLAIFLYGSTVRAQSGDGGTADGYSNSNLGSAGTGADGSSSSSANLSTGAIVAISVIAVVVIVGGITLAVLFYLAKKRQWAVRETIRRTASKAVRAMTPRTDKFAFPRSPRADKQHTFMQKNTQLNSGRNKGDVEKGFTSIDEQLLRTSEESGKSKQMHPQHTRDTSDVNKKLPRPKPTINVPSSHFEMESPLKSPMWHRVLGRK